MNSFQDRDRTRPTSEEVAEIATRRNTLILANATSAILRYAGVKPEEFNNIYNRRVSEDGRSRILRRPIQAETGFERACETITRGWQLTRQLKTDAPDASTHALLVLEESGLLAVVTDFSSSFGPDSYSRDGEIGRDTHYPRLGIVADRGDYVDSPEQEAFVQHRLAGLVVPDGLHEGTVLEGVYQNLADTTSG